MTFEELGLDEVILRAVSELGFESPTPIQAAAIPVMLQTDDDLLGLAQTGTGKTAAFGLPLLHHLMQAPFRYEGVRTTRALVLAPTRELCMQISKDLKLYGKYSIATFWSNNERVSPSFIVISAETSLSYFFLA